MSTWVRPRRVSFVADSETWGGAEVYLSHLLRRAGPLGWHASVVAAEPVAGRLHAAVPDVPCASVPLARHASSAPQVAQALRAQAPDVVLVNLVDPASNAAAVAAALGLAPTTATLHLDGDTGAGEQHQRLVEIYGRLSAVITPAEPIRSQVVTDLGVPRSRTHVLPNGVDVPADPSGPAGRRPVRIGAHARLTRQKGLDVLLAAVRMLVQDGAAVEVVIGGEGRERGSLVGAAEGLPVRFPGFVPDARAFLRGLDVFCLPSRREALPLSLLEAMADGLPCVATDVGDVRAVLAGALALVPPEDHRALAAALRHLVEDEVHRHRLGGLARRRAEQCLDAGLMARRTFDVLRSVREEKSAARLHMA